MAHDSFIPQGEDYTLLEDDYKNFLVYNNVMGALAEQVRRITKTSNKLSIEKMTERLRNVSDSLDTSDATAVAEYILKDYTAYVNGKKVTGTMPYVEGRTIVPGTSDVVAVPAGTYVKGDIIIKAVEGGGTPSVPDTPSGGYDVVSSLVELTENKNELRFTLPAGNMPISFSLTYDGSIDSYVGVAMVEGTFKYNSASDNKVTITRVVAYDADNNESIEISAEARFVPINNSIVQCVISVDDAEFFAGDYTLKQYYNKEG